MKLHHSLLSILSLFVILSISVHCFPRELSDSKSRIARETNNGDGNDEDKKGKSDGDSPNNPSDGDNIYLTDRKTGERVAKWNESMKNNPSELGSYMQGDILEPAGINRNGLKNEYYRWPGGVVPYVIQGAFNQDQLNLIYAAFNDYHKYSCLRFVPRTNQKDFIRILSGNTGCWSSVGKVGGAQDVNLQTPGCVVLKGTVIHELMHAVGFWHEQSREDRDNYVAIQWGNIETGQSHNFDKVQPATTTAFGEPYDFHSVMHYSAYAFSKNNQPTIVPLPKWNVKGELGQRYGFSQTDVNKIWKMYKCQRPTIGS